ncbi:putative two-component sensor kinase [Salmonella enterica subsp. enterica]|nr:putative two-component sensor kinase [Salmonella enterica subsp. enterica]
MVTRFTENILAQNTRMQALVETLLRQARLENRQDIPLAPVAVDELFTQLSEARSIQLAAKKITLTLRPSSLVVVADAELLAQALGNVLDNAIDFTPENGVITLSAQPMGEKAILQVTDSGCGIPDFALPRIFDRFYSLPRENGRKSSGLGLAFVSEAARLLNGEVTLCNRPEGGVLASLTLHRHFT